MGCEDNFARHTQHAQNVFGVGDRSRGCFGRSRANRALEDFLELVVARERYEHLEEEAVELRLW